MAAVLGSRIDGSDVAAPITGQSAASLRSAVERSILVDDRVSRVRVWSTDGLLLFSSDTADRPGSDAGLTDQIVGEAASDGALTRTDVSDTGGVDDPERSLVRTYAPLDVAAVAEIDQTDEGTLGQVRTEWMWYRILAGAFVVLLLVMTMLSLRDPIERINVGVPFATSSVPAGFSLIDDERLHAVEDVYRLAQERVARLEAKLAESEEIRRRLEGDIQRALSKAVSSGEQPAASAPVEPQAPAPPAPVVRVPESEVVPAPLGETWAAAAPAGPLARATRDQKTPPSTSPRSSAKQPKQKQPREAEAGGAGQAEAPPAQAEGGAGAERSEGGGSVAGHLGARAREEVAPAPPSPEGEARAGAAAVAAGGDGPVAGRQDARPGDRRRQGARGRARDVHPADRERPAAARHDRGRPGGGPRRPGADRRPQEARRRAPPAARRTARGVAGRAPP